jgi:hypothetical protein
MAETKAPKKTDEKSADKKRKFRVPKVVRNTLIAILIILVLMIAAGIAYTYFGGEYVPPEVTAPVTPPPATVLPTRKPAPGSPVGGSVQFVTTPVAPGANASITVKTTPDALCTIKVEYDKKKSQDDGLIKKMADEYGNVSWTWTVEETAPEGKWPIEVTCELYKKSGMVQTILEVKKGAKPLQ